MVDLVKGSILPSEWPKRGVNGIVFQRYFNFFFEFLAGILSNSLINTKVLMLNFFEKRPALNQSNTSPVLSLYKLAELDSNRNLHMG